MPNDGLLHHRIDELLAPHEAAIAADLPGYRGHLHRVAGLTLAHLGEPLTSDEREQLAVAAVYHDLAIWLDGTFDYLEPSIGHAAAHLRSAGHDDWVPRISRIIDLHHRLRPVTDDPLVEAFRRADLADLTFGAIAPGIPRGTWRALHADYPVAGFHRRLVQLAGRQLRHHPLQPLPMLRW